MNKSEPTSLLEFEKALISLEKALSEPKTDITRDASIQRFEFCVELAWKTAKKKMGSDSIAPKVIVREMAQQRLIEDPELWIQFVNARNESSHTYKEDVARRVLDVATHFLPEGKKLLSALKKL